MIIEDFKYPVENSPNIKNVCTQACPEPVDPCDHIYEALTVRVSSGPAQGHTCNRAKFDAWILDFPSTVQNGINTWIYLQPTNFNNVPPPPGQTQQITYDIIVSKKVVEHANRTKNTFLDCCNLNMALIPSPYPDPITLPFIDNSGHMIPSESGIFLPPVESTESNFVVNPRDTLDVHSNIVLTRISRNSDQTVLIPDFIWQGKTPIDLCVGLLPKNPVPQIPVFPAL